MQPLNIPPNKKLLLLGLLVLYVLVVARNIRFPGLHYDEMLFVNAALGAVDDSFIVKRIGAVPVLLCSYMGALKAYLYFPIFSIFEVSPQSVRLPMILLTAFSFLVLFRAVRVAFREQAAWAAFLLLLACPSIMAHTRMDNGPTAIQFFLKSVCLLLVFLYYRFGRKRRLVLLYAVLWVGIYYNVKFVWFINSLFFSSLLLYGHVLIDKLRQKDLAFLAKTAAGALVAFAPFALYFLLISQDYPLANALSLQKKLISLSRVLQGVGVYRTALGPLSNPPGVLYLAFLGVLLLGGTLCVFRPDNRSAEKTNPFLFLWALLLTTLLQVFLTPQAKWSWHAFKIYPELLLLAAVCICEAGRVLGRRRLIYGRSFVAAALALMLAYNGFTFSRYLQAFQNQTSRPYWSEVVYDVIDYTGRTPGRFFSATWGIHNQLISFHRDPYKFKAVHEDILWAETDAQIEHLYKLCFRELRDPHYFILRPNFSPWQRLSNKRFFEIARRTGVELEEVRRFYDKSDQQDIFVLYRIKKRGAPPGRTSSIR